MKGVFSDSKSGDLRLFPNDHLWKFSNADENSLLCTKCRKEVTKYNPSLIESQTPEQSQSQHSSDQPSSQGSTHGNFVIEDSINTILGVSPIKKKLYVYLRSKLFKFITAVDDCLAKKSVNLFSTEKCISIYISIITGYKELLTRRISLKKCKKC